MGCISSKIMTRSGSFQEWKQSMQKRSNHSEVPHNSKNGGEQFLALLYTANTITRRLKEQALQVEHESSFGLSINKENSKTIETAETNRRSDSGVDIQIMNKLELLDDTDKNEKAEDLEDTKKLASTGEDKFVLENNSKSFDKIQRRMAVCSRSIHTVEEFDALVAKNAKEGNMIYVCNASVEQIDLISESTDIEANAKETSTALIHDSFREKGWKRKAMAKELGTLNLPSFEFAKSSSLREWLQQGGQVCSPGSYITPKFGIFNPSNQEDGTGEYVIFDPDLVAIFEKEMQRLTADEKYILEQI